MKNALSNPKGRPKVSNCRNDVQKFQKQLNVGHMTSYDNPSLHGYLLKTSRARGSLRHSSLGGAVAVPAINQEGAFR